MDDAAKGFDNLQDSVKDLDFNPVAKALDTVTSKFSALEIMAITALVNITNSAVNMGKNRYCKIHSGRSFLLVSQV